MIKYNNMKRKEEVETMIFTIARRISTLTEHIGNGNTDDFDMLSHVVSEMELFQEYVKELNELKILTAKDNPIVVTFSDKRNEL